MDVWMDYLLDKELDQRGAVNGSVSKCPRLVTNVIPQRSVLGLVLLYVFVGDIDSRPKGTLIKFANSIKLIGAGDMLEERDDI